MVAYSLCVAGFAWFFAGLQRCDESCAQRSDPSAASLDWARFSDAWQWTAIVWLGVAGVLLAGVMAALVWRGRAVVSAGAACLWVVAAACLGTLVNGASSNTGADLLMWLVLGVALVVGTVASGSVRE